MKTLFLLFIAFSITYSQGFGQEDDSQAVRKMKVSADLTVEWLRKNIKISDEQADDLLKILIIPKETIKELGILSKEYPDSLHVVEEKLSLSIKQDFEHVFTASQWEKYNNRKEELNKWLEKRLKDLGY